MDYFVSDFHNMDTNIIGYMKRPYTDVYDMRDKLIDMWNNTVEQDDTIYYLGDIGDSEILNELDGNIVFVCGNHDDPDEIEYDFPDIKVYDKPVFISKNIIISHAPVEFIPPEAPFCNIHGHLHKYVYGIGQDWNSGLRYFNVSLERLNYKMISLEEIEEKLNHTFDEGV